MGWNNRLEVLEGRQDWQGLNEKGRLANPKSKVAVAKRQAVLASTAKRLAATARAK